jgi:hypothetical protein
MEPNIYQKIFNHRYSGGIMDVEGIKVKLIEIVEDDDLTPPYTLNFEMVNPMGLSYTKLALESLVGDQVESLNEILDTPYYLRVDIINSEDLFLGDDFTEVFSRMFKGVKQLNTDVYEEEELGENVYASINIEHKSFDVELLESQNTVQVINRVKFLDAHEVVANTHEIVNSLTFDEAVSVYGYYVMDNYTESDNYPELVHLEYPLLVDNRFMNIELITSIEK